MDQAVVRAVTSTDGLDKIVMMKYMICEVLPSPRPTQCHKVTINWMRKERRSNCPVFCE